MQVERDNQPSERRTLMLGLGSAHGDDQAGWLVIDELERRLAGTSLTISWRKLASPIDVIQELEGVDELRLCDACEATTGIDRLSRWSWPTLQLVRTRSSNSHQLGLPEVLELAATLKRLPARVEIWGICGTEFRPGSEASPSVRAACLQLAGQWSEEFAGA